MQNTPILSKLQQQAGGKNPFIVTDPKSGKELGAVFISTYRGFIRGEVFQAQLKEQNQYLADHPDQYIVGIADVPGSAVPDMVTNLADTPENKTFFQHMKNGRVLKLLLVARFNLIVKAAKIFSRILGGVEYLEESTPEKALERASELIRQAHE
jgi:hypothetical protein